MAETGRERVLTDPVSGKTGGTVCEGEVVRHRSGVPGKKKGSEKREAEAKAAQRYASAGWLRQPRWPWDERPVPAKLTFCQK